MKTAKMVMNNSIWVHPLGSAFDVRSGRAPKRSFAASLLRLLRILLLVSASFAHSVILAQASPSATFLDGQLISPASAMQYYGIGVTRTSTSNILGSVVGAPGPQVIQTIARNLGADDVKSNKITKTVYINRVQDYLRLNIKASFTFGLTKGGVGALIDGSGTTFDAAEAMANLLAEANITATYVVGTITLSPEQFARWTGVFVPGVIADDGHLISASVDAAPACKLLANGGIPALINGSATASCTYSGQLASVQLLHIWIQAEGQSYDPSLTQSEVWQRRDIAALANCGTAASETCSSTVSAAALAGSASGTLASGTVPYVTNVNLTSVSQSLNAYSTNLLNSIRSIDPNSQVSKIVGGLGRADDRLSTTQRSPINPTVLETFGAIPDKYRTKLTVQVDNINKAIWADEVGSERLRIFGSGSGISDPLAPFTRTLTFYLEWNPIATSSRSGATLSNDQLTLSVNFPYAASLGNYGDFTKTRQTFMSLVKISGAPGYMAFVQPQTIIHQFGSANEGSLTYLTGKQKENQRSIALTDPTNVAHDVLFTRGITVNSENRCLTDLLAYGFVVAPSTSYYTDQNCLRLWQPTVVQHLLAQDAYAQDLVGRVGGTIIQNHVTIGSFSSGAMNLEPVRSTSPVDATVISPNSNRLPSAMITGWLEGGIFEQEQGEWEGQSGLSLMIRSNDKSQKFLGITNSNLTSALGVLNNYTNEAKGLIQTLVGQGHRVVAPQSGDAGSFSFGGATLLLSSNGLAGFKTDYSSLGTLVNIGFKGASPGTGDPANAALKSVESNVNDFRPSDFAKVSLADGSVTLGPFEDIGVGPPGSGNELSFNRTFSSAIDFLPTETSFLWSGFQRNFVVLQVGGYGSKIGGGWTHNHENSLSMQSNGFRGLGSKSAAEASQAIVGTFVLGRLASSGTTVANDLPRLFTAYWTGESLVNNAVELLSASESDVFVRLANGTLQPSPGSNLTLRQSGDRVGPSLSGVGSSVVYVYSPITFTLTTGDGAITTYDLGGNTAYSEVTSVKLTNMMSFKPLTTIFPDGRTISRTYVREFSRRQSDSLPTVGVDCLTEVKNSAGYRISIAYASHSAAEWKGMCPITSVSDDYGRSATYSGIPVEMLSGGYPAFSATIQSPGGITDTFNYSEGLSAEAKPRDTSSLISWYRNGSPQLTFTYDGFARVSSVTDGTARASSYFGGGILGEEFRPGRRVDELGNQYYATFDQSGALVAAEDALGRKTISRFAENNVFLRSILPEGNAVERSFDLRGNQVKQCTIAKGRIDWATLSDPAALQCNPVFGDLVETTAYVGGPTILASNCPNAKTCNRPAYVIDANGHRTDYTWDAGHGQVLKIVSGLDTAGVCQISGGCPETSFFYSPFIGSDGVTFYLLTSKAENNNSTESTVITYEYDIANKFALKAAIATSGGVSLRTCFSYDGLGRRISETQPLAGLASCP